MRSMLMEIATFQTEMYDSDSDTLGPFEMLMEIGEYEAERYDSENERDEDRCIIDSDEIIHRLKKVKLLKKNSNSLLDVNVQQSLRLSCTVRLGFSALDGDKKSNTPTEDLHPIKDPSLLKQPMKRTLKRRRNSETREPKLMNSAMKDLYEIPGYYNEAKRENDIGIFVPDVIAEEPMKKKQRDKQKQKVVKNSVTSRSSQGPKTKILKRNLKELSNKEWIEEIKNRKKKVNDGNLPLIPSLPEEFEREIINRCGNQISRIIQKPLYSTDLSTGHNRITMPCSQVESFEFLKDTEMTSLRKDEAITVPVIHRPSKNGMPLPLTETPLEFKQWNLHKNDPRKENPQYVLRTAWRKVVLEDELKIGDTVQIWTYRNAQDKLCMALVKLDSGEVRDATSN